VFVRNIYVSLTNENQPRRADPGLWSAHTRRRPIRPAKYPSSRMTFCRARFSSFCGSFVLPPMSSGVIRTIEKPTSAYASNFSMIARPPFGCSCRIMGSSFNWVRNRANYNHGESCHYTEYRATHIFELEHCLRVVLFLVDLNGRGRTRVAPVPIRHIMSINCGHI
jgi:hypothetical protein